MDLFSGLALADIFLAMVNALMRGNSACKAVELSAVAMEGGRGVNIGADRDHNLLALIVAKLERADFAAAFYKAQDRALMAVAASAGVLTLTVLLANVGFVGSTILPGPPRGGSEPSAGAMASRIRWARNQADL